MPRTERVPGLGGATLWRLHSLRALVAFSVSFGTMQGCTVIGYSIGSNLDRTHFSAVQRDTELATLRGRTVRVTAREQVITGHVEAVLTPTSGRPPSLVIHSTKDDGAFLGTRIDTVGSAEIEAIQVGGEPGTYRLLGTLIGLGLDLSVAAAFVYLEFASELAHTVQ